MHTPMTFNRCNPDHYNDCPPKPKTGDYMSVVMYVLAGIAGIMAVICSFFRKKAVSKKKH